MALFIVKRIFYMILVLLLVSAVMFGLFRTMPGDPTDIHMPPEAALGLRPEEVEAIRAEIRETMGLDRSHVVQYFIWLGDMFQGNFGYSIASRQPIWDHISAPMANTIFINIINVILIFSITIPVGVYCAIRRGKLFDNGALVFSMFGLSVPNFLFALILIFVFAILLGWFPIFGIQSIMAPEPWTMAWFGDRMRHMALPLATMVLTGLAGIIRFTRTALIDALNMDCIRTARAKGVREKTVIFVHAFRNSLITIITVTIGAFLGVFGGSVVIETTFGWNGMGRVMLTALNQRDIGVLMTMNMFFVLMAFLTILIMEILYVIVDPRIRFR